MGTKYLYKYSDFLEIRFKHENHTVLKNQINNKYSKKSITFADKVFATYDMDNNGSITKNELLDMIDKLSKEFNVDRTSLPLDTDMDQVILYLDRDGNGSVEKEEFSNWLSNGIKLTDEKKQQFKERNEFTKRLTNFLDCVLESIKMPKIGLDTLFRRFDYYDENRLDKLALEDFVDYLCSETGTILDHSKISETVEVILYLTNLHKQAKQIKFVGRQDLQHVVLLV